jgi:putative oxygen-independent coproporphyrinogen III oxidase
MESHTAATLKHLDLLRAGGTIRPVTSVFFGGGTPSLLPPDHIARILDSILRDSGTSESAIGGPVEVTVECNPDTVSPEMFDVYARAGVTRISFGVQSMVDHVLLALGRSHQPNNVRKGVEWAKAAGLTFNLDVIYGGAGETLNDWALTVDRVLELDPPHVSAYALTIEAGTPLALDTARHPDDDDLADKYLLATERFAAQGLDNYEISNWSRPGFECRHNWLYWMQGDYLGVGCAAHSHEKGRRWWNKRTPERYIDSLTVEGVPTAEIFTGSEEHLDEPTRTLEGLQLVLRTRRGVPIDALSTHDCDELSSFINVDSGLTGRITLKPTGRLMANEIANRLLIDLR